VLECWFVQEKAGARGGGFPAAMTQEKSLMIVSRESEQPAPPHSDGVQPNRVYQVTDAGGSLCRSSLRSVEGAVEKPQCEINPFLPQPALVQWAAPLTSVALSPAHLQADWLSASLQGLDGRLVLSNVMRVPTGTNQATGEQG
ncbi:TPSN protein, partial [Amia calva]|nr:TPSN protein [Amia calva]